MRTNAMVAGLALMLGLTLPVAAAPPGSLPAADEGMGARCNRLEMRGPGGWQGGFGHFQRHARPSFIRMLLQHQQDLGLTTQQVDALRKLGLESWRAAIQRGADLRIAQLDLLGLRWSDTLDLGTVEAKVREIEKLRADGLIAAFRTADAARAQLTGEQREKAKSLWGARRQRRGAGMTAPPVTPAPVLAAMCDEATR